MLQFFIILLNVSKPDMWKIYIIIFTKKNSPEPHWRTSRDLVTIYFGI